MTDHEPERPESTPPDPFDPPTSAAWKCNPSLEEVYRYIDGHLGEPERSQVASHLQICTGCDDILHFHMGLKSMLGSCREDMPPEFRQRLLDSITKLF